MAELDKIMELVRDTLADDNTDAFVCGYPAGMKKRREKPVVAVYMKGGSGIPPGFYEYMGMRYNPDLDDYTELYGKKLDLTLGLYIYSPKIPEFGADACMAVLRRILERLSAIPGCLKVKEIQCGETMYDDKTDMFLCPAELKCTAFMYAEKQDDGEILDFILRGVIK